jgi:hypothetical protein
MNPANVCGRRKGMPLVGLKVATMAISDKSYRKIPYLCALHRLVVLHVRKSIKPPGIDNNPGL